MTVAGARRFRPTAGQTVIACVALLVLLAAGSLVLASRGGGGTPAQAEKLVSAKGTLSSSSILFGDTVEAKLDLVVPRAAAGSRFRGNPDFGPFRIVSRQIERQDLGGGLERISLTYGLDCLTLKCEGTSPSTEIRFAPTVLSVSGRTLRAVWPPLVQVSRLSDVSAPVTGGLDSGPLVGPGLQPGLDTNEALGAAGGSLVLLLAVWLYLRLRVRRRLRLAAEQASLLQTLLARVESGLPEDVIYWQRHALDAVAVELRRRRVNGSLAVDALRLAWAPEQPDPDEIRALVARIRGEVET